MKDKIYLDHASTTPTLPEVLQSMEPYFSEYYGNPSGVYCLSKESRKARETARERVANLINCSPEEIVFTACGTESDNFAIKGISFANKEMGNHIITSHIEHHAVLNSCKWLEKQGFEVTYVNVDRDGIVDVDEIRDSVRDSTILITIMHANNEVGTIQPIKEITEIAKEKGIFTHTDAVQTVGKINVDVAELGLDMLSLSAHKFYGPKGVGALYIKNGVKPVPLLHGGHHEQNRRAGTENIPGIVGLGKACEIAGLEMKDEEKRIRELRDELERRILETIDDVIVNGHREKRLAMTLNICAKYVEGESVLLQLDKKGIYASSGSACTSDSLEPSHVLLAMGVKPEVAHGSLRFTLGRSNDRDDIDRVMEFLPPIVKKMRDMSPLGKGK